MAFFSFPDLKQVTGPNKISRPEKVMEISLRSYIKKFVRVGSTVIHHQKRVLLQEVTCQIYTICVI